MLFEKVDLSKVMRNNLDSNKFAGYGWQNNFSDKNGLLQFGYIWGYKEAGDMVVDHMDGFGDSLMFPIFFCYRQYLELLLKHVYRNGLKNDEQYEKEIRGIRHELKPLWMKTKDYIREYIGHYTLMTTEQKERFIVFFEETINLFDSLDDKSFNFRYPEDKELKQSIKQNPLWIDFARLKELVDAIDEQMMASYEYSNLNYSCEVSS